MDFLGLSGLDWKVALIPFTYGFVGWMTNWVALKMTFYPLQFIGIPPYLGWQGIIPRKAHKMAAKSVDVITERLLNIEEAFAELDPKEVESHLLPGLEEPICEAMNDFGRSINADIWDSLPDFIRDEIYQKVLRSSRETMRSVIREMKRNIGSLLDVKGIVLKSLTGKNVGLIVEVFQSVGRPEFRFIERSGLYFGFLLGFLQMLFWLVYPVSWTLPLQGVLVGYLTNYLAIRMIFRPLRPKVFFGLVTYQGLFMKRQVEVSKRYSEIAARKILTPRNIVRDIFEGKASEEVTRTIEASVKEQIDRMTTLANPLFYGLGMRGRYLQAREEIARKMTDAVLASGANLEEYLGRAIDLERMMGERMAKLPPQEFESILRSAFQEDEWLLILTGAVLGAIVGAGQMLLL